MTKAKYDDRFYMSQYGQDKIIEQICYPNKNDNHKGIFLEIGGVDGVDISNSYYLEKMKNWSGILVEPIKSQAESSQHNRWSTTINGLIYNYDGETEFLQINGYSEMLSGIIDGYNDKYYERIQREIKQHNQKTERIMLKCFTINTLMNNNNLKSADYLSLDVQTAELKVLQVYNPLNNPIKIISIDTNGINNDEIKQWFDINGYKQYWKHVNADEYIYVHPEFKFTWEFRNE
jgi:FkbM family methyltransferase